MKKLLLGLSACVAVAVITMAQVPVSLTPGSANQVLAISGTAAAPSISFIADPTTGFYRSAAGEVSFAGAGTQRTVLNGGAISLVSSGASVTFGNPGDLVLSRVAAGEYGLTAVLFTNLGTPASGTFCYCSDCTIANPCASGGSGAFAKRLNGVWICN